MIADFISRLESSKAKSVNPTAPAQDQWVDLVDSLASKTLFPLTNSWWTGGNIPGKKIQMLTYCLGIQQYEATCREALDGLKGFTVEYEDGKKTADEEMPKQATAAA